MFLETLFIVSFSLTYIDRIAPVTQCCEGNNFTRDRFSVIGHQKQDFLLKIQESLTIYELKPDLNKQCESTPIYLFT